MLLRYVYSYTLQVAVMELCLLSLNLQAVLATLSVLDPDDVFT